MGPSGRRPWAAAALLAVLVSACPRGAPERGPTSPAPTAETTAASPSPTRVPLKVEAVATGLEVPWALAFAPDGRLFLTERPGRVRVIEGGRLRPEPVAVLPVAASGEAGLMGLALDPDFPRNGFLYVMYTYRAAGGLRNRISRLRLVGERAGQETVILDGIPGAGVHDGGRLRFGPDGKLYATTGDATEADSAQDRRSLAGKILRISPDGSIPEDNPFPGSPVFSRGHRNPQGLDWQPGTGALFATEHGAVGNDEVNRIEPGKNYGWPRIEGNERAPGLVTPLFVLTPAVAPAGASFYAVERIPQWTGSFFFATLRGRHLHRVDFAPGGRAVALHERLFEAEFGRIRDVAVGPEGALYLATSNRDGRGEPGPGDDRILRVVPR